MSYSYQETGGTLTKTSGGFIVAHDGEGFEPFARTLTVSGNAVVYNDISVSSGGILYVGTKTVLSDCEVFDSGTITASTAVVFSNCTVHAGGTLNYANQNAQKFYNLTVEAGGKLANVRVNATFGGSNTNIAEGTLYVGTGDTTVTTIWASNGVIYNWKRYWGVRTMSAANVYFESGITLSNGVCDDQNMYISSGVTVKDFTVSMCNNRVQDFALFAGASAIDLVVADDQTASGQVRFADYTGENTLGGSKTNFAAGGVRYGGGSWTDPDLYADHGKLYNLNVIQSRSADYGYLENLVLISGISAMSPLVGNGGTLTLRNDGVAIGALVSGGILNVNGGGVASNAVVSGGGIVNVNDNGLGSDALVVADGRLNLNDGGVAKGVNISGGSVYAYDGGTLDGGSISGGLLRIYAGAQVGGVTMNTGNVYILDNAAARNMAQTNGRTYISGGATAYSMNMGGGFNYAAAGATLVNYTATGGNTYFSDSEDTPFLVGGDTNINTKRLRYYPNSNTGLSLRVTNGVVYDLGTDGNLFRLGVGDDILVSGGSVGNDCRLSAFGNAVLRGVKVTAATADAGAVLTDTAKSYDVELNGSGKAATLTVGGEATAFATVVNSGGELKINAGGTDVGAIVGGSGGLVNVSSGGVASATRALTNGRINLNAGASARSISISGGIVYGYNGCTVTDTELVTGGTLRIYAGATVSGVTMAAGNFQLLDNAAATGITQTAGKSYISGGAVAYSMNMGGGFNYVAAGATLVNYTATGGNTYFNDSADTPLLVGSSTNINANRLRYTSDATTALGLSVVNGEVRNLGKDGKEFRLGVGSGIVVKDAVLGDNQRLRLFDGAVASNASVVAGTSAGVRGTLFASGTAEIRGAVASGALTTNRALINLYDSAVAYDIVVDNCGTLAPLADGVKAYDTLVKSGGYLVFSAGEKGRGAIENTTILAGGTMTLNEYADTGDLLTLDFTGANGGTVNINDLGLINAKTKVVATGVEAVGTYTLGTGSRDGVTQAWGLYENALVNGGSYADALNGVTYTFDGTAITTTALSIATGAAAGLTGGNYTALRTNDRAAKWTSGAGATLVTESFAGDAWLEVAGDLTGALYGASTDFANTVNINATAGSIRNLAAGATAGGTVGAVKLTFAGADLAGAGYAGGFGNVTGDTETLIATGSFAKDFYAGALANKLTTTTSVSDVSMTIDGGTFSGNIYGASAVKTDTTKGNGTRHTAGDVTLTVTGGSTTKGYQACIFAGGYATGDATGTVYKVDSVTATISGGSWGEACGGRGVFGGIMASGVEAQVLGAVNITISGDATMGNVYGGGWAQKSGAKSIVGDVNINIAGGTITNVFGGGSHSTSGGTTETGDVTITVSGGTISGDIYARGQSEGDSTGDARVIFTGAGNFTCGVYGYSRVPENAGDGEVAGAALSFNDYTGTFGGKIGGFDGITLNGATAMTLTTAAADVFNGAWEFDLTDRADTLAGTSLLTWSSASFVDDTIKVTFADEAQAKGDWNIATVAEAFSGTTFKVEVGGLEIASVAYNQQIASGDYAGWGFELESGVLKFKNLA